jgi:thiamine biosynthesis lipoprotein ApbE
VKKLFLSSILILFLFVSLASLTGCAGRKTFSKEQYYLGSKFQITYQYKGNKTGKRQSAIVSRRIFDFLQLLDSKLNIVNPISEVSAVNGNGSFSAVPVSREIFEIFIKAKKAEELTEGAFGVTFVQLVDVVNQGNYTQGKIYELLPKVKAGSFSIDEQFNTVRLGREGVMVNLSRIQRGYAIDQLIEMMKKEKIDRAVIKTGRSTFVAGRARDAEWPASEFFNHPWKVKIKNRAFSTSSTAEDYFKNVQIWGPLVYPNVSGNVVLATGVIAPNAITSEVLSDAMMLLDPKRSQKLLEELGYEGYAVYKQPDGSLHSMTTGFFNSKVKLKKIKNVNATPVQPAPAATTPAAVINN